MDCHGSKGWDFKGAKQFLMLCLALLAMPSANAEEPVCASVKVEIQQELTLERQAFDAMMRINNGLDTLAIENVAVAVNFADENGIPVLATSDPNDTNPDAKFFIRIDTMDGIADVSGYGVVAPGTSGEIHWLIIPIPGAAEGAPGGKLYYVGAHLSYTIGGELEEVDVTPDFITVKPLPQLAMDYFLTRDVVGDDAFTEEVEPPEPYTLGLRISNNGSGPANSVAIDSGQPKITENEQGLLIGFTITGSTLDDQPATPDLKMNFGDIAPEESRVGRWIMETTLSGEFTDFTASVSHSDELGGAITSLIDANDVNTHYLLRDVRVDLPGRDRVRDFLAFSVGGDIDNLSVYESDTVDTEVSNLSSSATLVLNNVSGTESYYTLTVPVQPGFVYARLADPFNGAKEIKSVVRSDGKVISPDNAWNSKTRNRVTNPPSWEYWLNLFDVNTTGTYIIQIGEADIAAAPPVLQFIDDQVTAEGNQVGFLVQASDPNGDTISLTATPMPAGASFVDNGDGTATFNWTPSVGQAGIYSITYKASDGTLNATRSATIKVNPEWDTDGDGLNDAWELENFGNLDRDGSGDADGDGVSDFDEYLNGTDPNLPPPAVPTNVLAFSGNTQTTLLWPAVDGADSYRIYWSTEPGVSKQSGALLETDISPFTHSGLTNGATYYYVVTSVGTGGESAASAEISVVPGKFEWGVPGKIELGSGDVFDLDATVAADGSSLVVWTQTDGIHTNLWGNQYLLGSGWGTPVLIDVSDSADVSRPRLAIDPDGYAMVLWRESDGLIDQLWVADFSPTLGWGTPASLSSAASVGESRLVIRTDGSVVAVWSQGDTVGAAGSVWSATYVAGIWGSAARIEAANALNTASLQLASDANGNVLAVWSATLDGLSYDLAYNRLDAATGWGSAQVMRSGLTGDAAAPTVEPQLAMNSAGEAMLVWGESASPNSIWASRYNAAGGWETAAVLDSSDTAGAYMPTVAIDEAGNAVTAWAQSDGNSEVLYATRYVAGTGWDGAPAVLSVDSRAGHPGNVSAPVVAMNNDGNALISWQQDDGVQANIWARRYELSSASWLTPHIIETENAGDAVAPLIAMNGSGDTLVAWRQSDGQHNDLWANTFASGNDGMPNITPVVVVPGTLSVDEQTSVALSVSDSFDQDGTVVSYEWGQVSGSSVALTNAATANASFTAPTLVSAETLTFAVKVTDDLGGITEKLVPVTVNPVNALPVANAGADQSVDEQTPVSVTSTVSDSDGSVVSTSWTQVSGTQVTMSGTDSASMSFTAPALKQSEDLVFRVTVTDNEGGSVSDEVTITVNPVNHAPVVDAGADPTVDEQTAATLAGQATDPDVDGVLVSYAWSQLSGTPVALNGGNSLTAGFTAPTLKQAEVLTFRLSVTDDEGGVSTDDISVTVNPVNHAPVVNAGADQSVDEQSAVSRNGTASDPDADGVLVSYAWSQISGTPVTLIGANSLNAAFTAPTLKQAATLAFRLTVTDDEGGVSTDDISVTVNPVNHAPVVNAGADQSVDEQSQVSLSGTASDPDADGVLVSYAWSQISGTPVTLTGANSLNAAFTAPTLKQAATLAFSLTVTDDEGGVSTDDISVTVNPVNHAPVVDAGTDQVVDEQTVAMLTGSASDPDADGILESYQWSQVSGTAVQINNANSATATFTAPTLKQAVTLTLHMTVTDDEGGVAYDDIIVTVNPVNHPPVVNAEEDKNAAENTLVTLAVTATDPDADGLIASYQWTQTGGPAVNLSNAATDTASFIAPLVYQDTLLSFSVEVTDDEGGVASDTIKLTTYSTNPDDDADGVDDAWEMQYFGNLLQDGATDFDGDGITDLEEYQQGSTPTLLTAAIPSAVSAMPAISQVTLSWQPDAIATSYNIYWSTDPDVTPATGTLITSTENSYVHTGLSPETTYYYIITSVAEEESAASNEVNATAGRYAWEVATALTTDVGSLSSVSLTGGVTLSVWTNSSGNIMSALYSESSGWGVEEMIDAGTGGAGGARVAVDGLGNAIAVWQQSDVSGDNIWANRYSAGVGWGAAEIIKAGYLSTSRLDIAMDESGDAMVVGHQAEGIWALRYTTGAGWGTAEILMNFPDFYGYYSNVVVAMNGTGSAILAWEHFDYGASHRTAHTISYTSGAGWGNVETVGDIATGSLQNMYTPSVAMDAAGNVMVVWCDPQKLMASWYSPANGWQMAQLAMASEEQYFLFLGDHQPALAMTGDGAVVAWSPLFPGIQVMEYRFDSGWGMPQQVSSKDVSESTISLIVDSAGKTTLAFASYTNYAWAVMRDPDSGWGDPQLLGTTNINVSIVQGENNAIAFWNSPSNELLASRYRLFDSPPVADTGLPQIVYGSQSVSLDASASSDVDGVIQSYQWTGVNYEALALASDPQGSSSDPVWSIDTSASESRYYPKYALTVIDDDGAMVTGIKTVTVLEPDTDQDGMDDLWELQHFGELNLSDESSDFDGDGFADWQELEQGTNPTLLTPASPQNVALQAGVSEITLTWDPVPGAVAYNVYWSYQSGVDRTTGTQLTASSSPYLHANLEIGSSYYYVVTAVGADESVESVEVSAMAGQLAWSSATSIHTDVGLAIEAKPVLAAGGNRAVAVWEQSGNIQAAVGESGVWGAGELLETSSKDARNPDVSMNESGVAVAVWEQISPSSYSILASRYDPATGWSAAELLETGSENALNPTVVVDGNGNATAVWHQFDGATYSVYANHYLAGTGWGSPQFIENLTMAALDSASLAVDGSGNVMAAWAVSDGSYSHIYANRYEPLNGWVGTQQISFLGDDVASSPDIVADAAGNFIAVWESDSSHLRYARYTVANGWDSSYQLSTVAATGIEVSNPVVRRDDNANVLTVWVENSEVMANHFKADTAYGGYLSPKTTLSRNGAVMVSTQPALVMTQNGDGVALWEETDGAVTSLWYSQYDSASGWGATARFESEALSAYAPALAVHGDGTVMAAWAQAADPDFIVKLKTLSVVNASPKANAGVDQSIYSEQPVTLDGTLSSDSDGTISSYYWTQVSGPSVSLNDPGAQSPTFIAPLVEVGTPLVFSLTVSDDRGATASDSIVITVLEHDTDEDGIDDLWELQYFGDLSRDGSLDLDGDGISDMQEFLQGTDPTVTTPLAPTGVIAVPASDGTILSWDPVTGASAYNIYWSSTPGVSLETGNKISDVTSPYEHAGLTLGVQYYYIITANDAAEESAPSQEVTAVAGQAVWEPAVAIESLIGDSGQVSLDVTASGDAMAVWSQADGIYANIWATHYSVGTGWTTPELIENDDTGPAENARVVVDDAGNAIAVWQQSDGSITNIWANRYTAGGGWGSAELIEFENLVAAESPQLDIAPDGSVMAVWQQSDGSITNIWANRYTVGTGWATAELVETDDNGAATGAGIALDGSGNAIAVWQQSDGVRSNIWANTYTVGNGWGLAGLIESDDIADAAQVALDVDAAGNAVAAWQQSDGIRTNIMANRYTAGTGWGSAELIESDDTGSATGVQVVIDGIGTATAVWEQSNGSLTHIWSNRYLPGSGWGTAELVESDDTGNANVPVIDVAPGGEAVALWQQWDGARFNIKASRYYVGNGWSVAELVESDDVGDAVLPAVRLDDQGTAFAAWLQWDGSAYNIKAARNVLP